MSGKRTALQLVLDQQHDDADEDDRQYEAVRPGADRGRRGQAGGAAARTRATAGGAQRSGPSALSPSRRHARTASAPPHKSCKFKSLTMSRQAMSDSPMLDNRSKPLRSLANYPFPPLIGHQPAVARPARAPRGGVGRVSRARPARRGDAEPFRRFRSFDATPNQPAEPGVGVRR